LSTQGIYSADILRLYSKDEINEFGREIVPERDKLFNYIGLKTLADRYLAKSYDGEVYELPQERFMIIAMTLMMYEREDHRADLVKEAYWALSNLYMTVATPTLANAGLSFGQLSSCFIDTVDDSLRSIYDSNTDVAMLSKNGGGIGVYVGKLRARGSDIKGFKGVSSGVIPWVRQLNNTAVSVDQLGRRKGSIAVYLDVWHKDILAFLDLKLNNGDERLRAHDIFPGVCIPDLFMESVRDRGDWYLFDPHEVRRIMGYSLEDFYDEEKGEGSFRQKYEECVDSPELAKVRVPAIEIMKSIMKSQLETGTP
ncbi:ribonucleoside-diphosphate reductase subunit alpha, partial [Paenibacillus larvae]